MRALPEKAIPTDFTAEEYTDDCTLTAALLPEKEFALWYEMIRS